MIKIFIIIHARFIDRFGTHVVVGVTVGGKDVIYVRQDQDGPMSIFQSTERSTSLLNFLKDKANMRFTDSAENHCLPSEALYNNKEVSIPSLYVLSACSGEPSYQNSVLKENFENFLVHYTFMILGN